MSCYFHLLQVNWKTALLPAAVSQNCFARTAIYIMIASWFPAELTLGSYQYQLYNYNEVRCRWWKSTYEENSFSEWHYSWFYLTQALCSIRRAVFLHCQYSKQVVLAACYETKPCAQLMQHSVRPYLKCDHVGFWSSKVPSLGLESGVLKWQFAMQWQR